ncbi:hypothetical protein [Shimia marina]|uniref:Flp pilus assembly protein, pilin Flp n=1 Tax=Shimia marina TaxID=321267 RepID=A0A0P1EQS7_9RHOB|nr:hypothetical protein [Shimia marina]CUH52278.1 hypothetical protein SHM7688_01724 [Shimia marina]SFE07428.1 hypothetical protein SAMN04488037_10546 [Shimia marina]
MKFSLSTFRREEAGAVTVDWVVLTAAVVGLAVAAFAAIEAVTDEPVRAAAVVLNDADAATDAVVVPQ